LAGWEWLVFEGLIHKGVFSMLVLTRKLEQSIQIGDDVTITILSVKGNTVRIGISAPEHVRVARTELARKLGGSPGSHGPTDVTPVPLVGGPLVGGPLVGEMEVVEVQSRPDAPIQIDRRALERVAPSESQATAAERRSESKALPRTSAPLRSRLRMDADENYATHHLRIRVEQ
jgi:carbon storage regulator